MRKNWIYEVCRRCTREQRLAWSVSDELWEKVSAENVLCLECFLRQADERNVKVRLEDIKFTGLVSWRD